MTTTDTIQRARIRSTAVTVTRLGFGAAPIGNLYAPVAEDTALAAVDAAWQAGIRYFDTAPHYGLGLSERRLGRALARRPRGEFTIASKVGRLLVPNATPTGSDLANGFAVPDDLRREVDYSAAASVRGIEESLGRLGLDRLDIALVHDPDHDVAQVVRETVPALCRLRDEGVIGAVGIGMNYWQPLEYVVRHSDVDAVMVAGRWTLLDRSAAPLLELCAERGVAVLAAAPFNSGILAHADPPDDATFDYAPASPGVLARARAIAAAARAHGVEPARAALQFPLRHPAVVAVVAGMVNAAQAQAAARWLAEPVPEDAWPDLDVALPLPDGACSHPPEQP